VRCAAAGQDSGVESHEWFENGAEGKIYFRANFMSGRWTVMTATRKRDPEWTDLVPVPAIVWRELREIVWRKYQRKRCPWERVAELDRILAETPDEGQPG
jgi:hypothetical protein